MSQYKPTNLNRMIIPDDGSFGSPLDDYSGRFDDVSLSVYFEEIEARLAELIPRYHVVVGCVAWLTSHPILEALGKCSGVSIIVQKEDFLRRDAEVQNFASWKAQLRAKYDALPTLNRYGFDGLLRSISQGSDPSIGVRCCGVASAKGQTTPRMHNKFLVLCDVADEVSNSVGDEIPRGLLDEMKPVSVWTGSFNMTMNATRSFENALFIDDRRIARAYFDQFQQIAALSEPLDWESEEPRPEWRIGT